MLDFLLKRPLILSALGCILASVFGFYSKSALLCYMILVLIWFLFFAFRKNFNMGAVFLLTLICGFSMLLTLNRIDRLSNFDNKTINCTFVVTNINYSAEEFHIAECEIIDRTDQLNRSKVTVFLNIPDIITGNILNADLTFSKIDSEYLKTSYSEGIYLNATSENVIKTNKTDFILSAAEKVRQYIKTSLFDNMNYNESATMCALLFGDKNYFTDFFYSCLLGSGTSHVMVVSGMHLSIIVTLFTYLINRVIYNRYLKSFFILLSVLIMSTLCGFTMSILRAGITYVIIAFAVFLGREYVPENILGCAISIILLFSPLAIFSIALQLSTLATFGILCVSIPVNSYLKSRNIVKSKLLLTLIGAISVSLSAILLTLPVTIYNFEYISKATVITNLLISTPVTFSVIIAVITLIVNLFSPILSKPLFLLCETVTSYINDVIITFGSNENSIAYIDKKYWIVAVFAILLVFWGLLACKKRINMLKLEEKRQKILKEGGKKIKWQ